MTATEELRALLDERGVEHYDGTNGTLWGKDASGYRFSADELTSGRMSVHMWCETPEQAVAATLGPGTCRIELPGMDYQCNGCGEIVGSTDPTSELYIDGNAIELWQYCPSCGRKVIKHGG